MFGVCVTFFIFSGVAHTSPSCYSFAEINQMWSDNSTVNVFIHYHSEETGSSVCEAQEDLNYEDSFTKELICYDGWTDVGLFVYFDDEFSIEECDECHPPEEGVDNVIAYYFEVSLLLACSVPLSETAELGYLTTMFSNFRCHVSLSVSFPALHPLQQVMMTSFFQQIHPPHLLHLLHPPHLLHLLHPPVSVLHTVQSKLS